MWRVRAARAYSAAAASVSSSPSKLSSAASTATSHAASGGAAAARSASSAARSRTAGTSSSRTLPRGNAAATTSGAQYTTSAAAAPMTARTSTAAAAAAVGAKPLSITRSIPLDCRLYAWLRPGSHLVQRFSTAADGKLVGGSEKDAKAAQAAERKRQLRRMMALLKPELGPMSISLASLSVASAINLVFPRAIGQVLDMAFTTGGSVTPTGVAVGLLGLFTVQAGFMFLRNVLQTISGERIAMRLRQDLFSHLVRQEAAFYDRNTTGDLLNRVSSDVNMVKGALTEDLSRGFKCLMISLGGIGMVVHLSPSLAAVSLAVIPPVAFVGMFVGRYIRGRQGQVQESLSRVMSVAEEVFNNIRVVKFFGQQGREVGRFSKDAQVGFSLSRQVAIAAGAFDAGLHLSTNISLVAVLWYGGHLVETGLMTPGALTSFLLYSVFVGLNLAGLSSVYSSFMKASAASSRVFEMLDRKPLGPVGTQVLANVEGAVRFADVHFAYPTRPHDPVLQGLNLTIAPDSSIAIVGSSGSGKSTLANLLTGLYHCDQGSVYIDGIPLTEIDPSCMPSVVGVVPQEPAMFDTTIAENIGYGKASASMEEIEAAAKLANAHEFIMSMNDGYQTRVGARGAQLSGGQKQRLAIARAVLANPRILILDEATSALDAVSEAAVTAALDRVMKGRTVIFIAHRLSTIMKADQVVVLQGGQIVEQGPVNQLLMTRDGPFATLMASQLHN